MYNFLHKQKHLVFLQNISFGIPLVRTHVPKLTGSMLFCGENGAARALELDNQDIFGDGNAISSLARTAGEVIGVESFMKRWHF